MCLVIISFIHFGMNTLTWMLQTLWVLNLEFSQKIKVNIVDIVLPAQHNLTNSKRNTLTLGGVQ